MMDERVRGILREIMGLRSLPELLFLRDNIEKLLEIHDASGVLLEIPGKLEQEAVQKANLILNDQSTKLSGPDSALLVCWLLAVDFSADSFGARQITEILNRCARKVANITTTMEILIKRGSVEVPIDAESGHRQYYLTETGTKSAEGIVRTLGREIGEGVELKG